MKVLLIGDYIEDITYVGKVKSLANDEPVLKFMPEHHYVTPGGIGYCEALLKSFLPKEVEFRSIHLSKASIVRYIDTKWNRNIITIHNKPQMSKGLHDHVAIAGIVEEHKPDLIYIWTDSEAEEESYQLPIQERLDRNYLVDALAPMSTLAVDMNDGTSHYYPADFAKSYASDVFEDCSYEPKCLVGTSSDLMKVWTKKKGSSNGNGVLTTLGVHQVPFLVDTCGAGDSFFTAFLSSLIISGKLKDYTHDDLIKALQIGECAAHLTCSHRGTYVPDWIEVLRKHRGLYASEYG